MYIRIPVYIYVCTHLFCWDIWKSVADIRSLSPLNSWPASTKIKKIVLYNHNTTITPMKFNTDTIILSNIQSLFKFLQLSPKCPLYPFLKKLLPCQSGFTHCIWLFNIFSSRAVPPTFFCLSWHWHFLRVLWLFFNLYLPNCFLMR